MKVYISVDAEGISGIYNLWQVMPSGSEYSFTRRMMANDVNAAVDGAFKAGAIQVIVNDAHNSGNNLLIDMLDERVDLISGNVRPLGMAQGAELCADAAFFIGYHARKGLTGVISHSYAYGSMVEMRLNGRVICEHDLIGHAVGMFGTPVVMLTGDNVTTSAACESVPGIYTVETKVCISDNAALCRHPKRVAGIISKAAEQALLNFKSDGIKPMRIAGDITIDVRFSSATQATLALMAPNTSRIDENQVSFFGPDYETAYKAFMCGVALAGGFRDDAALYK
jgi:D-amino peptidase